jgi:hypothetical protein
MRSSQLLCLAAALVLLTGASAQARVSHGYSNIFSLDTVTAMDDENGPPQTNAISTIYPNPFNPRTTIAFELAEAGHIELAIFDLRGRLVQVVESGSWPSGSHHSSWNGQGDLGHAVPTGTYFCRLSTPHGFQTKKMTLAR